MTEDNSELADLLAPRVVPGVSNAPETASARRDKGAMAADLSARLGLVDAALVPRLQRLCRRAGLPVQVPPLPIDRWMALMRGDKKTEAGEIRFVLIEGLGHAVVRPASDALVAAVIAAHTAAT